MVTVGLVAVDGMNMGCPPALAANRGQEAHRRQVTSAEDVPSSVRTAEARNLALCQSISSRNVCRTH
jgi:hypothetical protein